LAALDFTATLFVQLKAFDIDVGMQYSPYQHTVILARIGITYITLYVGI